MTHSKKTLEFIGDYFKKYNELSLKLNERTNRLHSNEHSYRIINYWEKQGLLTSERTNNTGWRKYSVVDLIWLQLLLEMRKFGFPIERLKELRESLLDKHPITKKTAFVELESYIALALMVREECYIHIFSNGTCICTSEQERKNLEDSKIFYLSPAISVSINWLIEQISIPDSLKISV